jgi:hypothetical protein
MTGLSHINQSALSDDAALAAEYGAEIERLRAELADTREILELVEQERDEYRGAITSHKQAIFREIGRPGSKMDRDLWAVLR